MIPALDAVDCEWPWRPPAGGAPPSAWRSTTTWAARAPSDRRRGLSWGARPKIPKISLATVYKALEALVASGAATKLTAGDGSARYDARSEDHYHVRCLRSGSVHDLPTPFDPDLIAKLDPGSDRKPESQGFQVTGYRLELVGYGERCTDPPAMGGDGSAGA